MMTDNLTEDNISIWPLDHTQVEYVWQRVSSCFKMKLVLSTEESEWVSTMCCRFNLEDVLELFKHQVFLEAMKHVQNIDHEDEELVAYMLVCNMNQAWETFTKLADKYTNIFASYTEEELMMFKVHVFIDAIKVALYPEEYHNHQSNVEAPQPQTFTPESFFV